MPVILNRQMLPEALHYFKGTQYCKSQMNIMIFTMLENMHPLHRFDFLQCRTATITSPKTVTAKLI